MKAAHPEWHHCPCFNILITSLHLIVAFILYTRNFAPGKINVISFFAASNDKWV